MQCRQRYGILPDDRIVLFLGTPRPHKGLLAIVRALKAIGDEKTKLLIIGTIHDSSFRSKLEQDGAGQVLFAEDQPFNDIPRNIVVADVICIMQDQQSEISKYQLPAKIIDAFAMGVPVIAYAVPPIQPLIEAGIVLEANEKNFPQVLQEVLLNCAKYRTSQLKKRPIFENSYSYRAIADDLERLFLSFSGSPTPDAHEDETVHTLLNIQREMYDVYEHAQRSETMTSESALDIVLFWKQNDTGIYGRRFDMFIKYLSKSPRVSKILALDYPVSWESLREKGLDRELNQNRQVYIRTMLRRWGVYDTEKVKQDTFIFPLGLSAGGPTQAILRIPRQEAS